MMANRRDPRPLGRRDWGFTPGRGAALAFAAACLALIGCAGGPAPARGGGAPPAPPEAVAFRVDVHDLEWVDTARERVVPARLYLPPSAIASTGDGVAQDRRWPLVIFSHGLGGSRFGYSHLGRYWASEGIATLHLQHTGSDRTLWNGRGLAMLSAAREAANRDQALARVHDVRFALNMVLQDPQLGPLFDPGRIGVAGHSFGANTSLLAVGARVRDERGVIDYRDPRIRAAILLSPPSLPAEVDEALFYSGIEVPTLHLTGTNDETPVPGLFTTALQRRTPFDVITATPRYLGVYDQGRHGMFNDRAGDAISRAIKSATRELTLAFWRSVFERDEHATRSLASPGEMDPRHLPVITSWETRR